MFLAERLIHGRGKKVQRAFNLYINICDPSGEKGPSGVQLSKSIFSHKLVNKLLNDTFINFILSQYMYFVKKSLVIGGIVV